MERFRKEDWTAPHRGYASKETSRVERQKPVCGIASYIAFPHYIEILQSLNKKSKEKTDEII